MSPLVHLQIKLFDQLTQAKLRKAIFKGNTRRDLLKQSNNHSSSLKGTRRNKRRERVHQSLQLIPLGLPPTHMLLPEMSVKKNQQNSFWTRGICNHQRSILKIDSNTCSHRKSTPKIEANTCSHRKNNTSKIEATCGRDRGNVIIVLKHEKLLMIRRGLLNYLTSRIRVRVGPHCLQGQMTRCKWLKGQAQQE